jgi:hypothetical protein
VLLAGSAHADYSAGLGPRAAVPTTPAPTPAPTAAPAARVRVVVPVLQCGGDGAEPRHALYLLGGRGCGGPPVDCCREAP